MKVSTFRQFIKLFKIALFNNKTRDFRTGKVEKDFVGRNDGHEKRVESSSFLMKIRAVVYNERGEVDFRQETTFVDFENAMIKTKNSGAL